MFSFSIFVHPVSVSFQRHSIVKIIYHPFISDTIKNPPWIRANVINLTIKTNFLDVLEITATPQNFVVAARRFAVSTFKSLTISRPVKFAGFDTPVHGFQTTRLLISFLLHNINPLQWEIKPYSLKVASPLSMLCSSCCSSSRTLDLLNQAYHRLQVVCSFARDLEGTLASISDSKSWGRSDIIIVFFWFLQRHGNW